MALLERVSTLIRANLNDLIDKAEEPEMMLKQVIVDMQNQLLQVKTQVAIAIADQHVLDKKRKENEDAAAEWVRKAELAVEKGEKDDVARYAIEKSVWYQRLAGSFKQQIEEQAVQVENLKSALKKLESKLAEAQSKVTLLVSQHRRARAVEKASEAGLKVDDGSAEAAFHRMNNKVQHEEALSQAHSELVGDSVEDRLKALEKQDQVERLLAEMKARKAGK
jgi:phage shock protein A